jgi:hypothetical protein
MADDETHQMVMPSLLMQWMKSSNPADQARWYAYLVGVIDASRPLVWQLDKGAKDGKDCATLLYDRMDRTTMLAAVITATNRTLETNKDSGRFPVTATVLPMLTAYCHSWNEGAGK